MVLENGKNGGKPTLCEMLEMWRGSVIIDYYSGYNNNILALETSRNWDRSDQLAGDRSAWSKGEQKLVPFETLKSIAPIQRRIFPQPSTLNLSNFEEGMTLMSLQYLEKAEWVALVHLMLHTI